MPVITLVSQVKTLNPDPTRTTPALTTVFTPEASCLSRWIWMEHSDQIIVTSGYYKDTKLASGIDLDYWKTCYASATQPTYSPGMCFEGQALNVILQVPIQVPGMSETQTQWQALCCPSGMIPSNYRQCEKAISTPFTVLAPVVLEETTESGWKSSTVWDSTSTWLYTTTNSVGQPLVVTTETSIALHTAISGATLFADPVTVYWQSTDLSLFPSKYASSLASAIGISVGTQTLTLGPKTLSSTTSSSTLNQQGVLSTGAKAGIGVGTVIGAALLVGVAFMFFLRLRRRKRQEPAVAELSGHSSGYKRFFGGKLRAEMEGKALPVEIDSKSVCVVPGPPAELEGSSHLSR
ncbi:hypothetical protein BU24DRAFT_473535 [Aaosphaeria arxii CBS 175.79]|uniref:Mid2 domain-containing protein n=1 Tax=Aaosphaeria arxii CBS 175.79 TaxID=1450172 RepID=A0A6A5X8L2_9PLEO|nr:uncharacterized protein BU24DRAFT_473535 [Aaosphaeria arxii CBS 175.79]KAF2009395.1 hypothetical protein BU24DRAFT_473535 [Aaosphaeria arxii CBS 175.79]